MQYKILFSLIVSFLFVACATQAKPPQVPDWYKSQILQTQDSSQFLGYGDAKTLFEAKSRAKEAIAQSLMSHVQSSFVLKTEVQKEGNKEQYSTQTKHNLKVSTKIDLQNLSILKQEYFHGRYFVLLEYKNLDLAYRIKESVPKIECGSVNKYIKITPLYKDIRRSFSCDIDLKLQRRNSAWYLGYKDKEFLLNNSEFEKLYVAKHSKIFDFQISKPELKDAESFYFRVDSKEKGYITLLDVYENGIVTVLTQSQKIEKHLQIPSKESANYFEAAVVKNSHESADLYVAIFTKKPLDMSRFSYADAEVVSSEVAHKFDELIAMLNTLDYATIVVHITK